MCMCMCMCMYMLCCCYVVVMFVHVSKVRKGWDGLGRSDGWTARTDRRVPVRLSCAGVRRMMPTGPRDRLGIGNREGASEPTTVSLRTRLTRAVERAGRGASTTSRTDRARGRARSWLRGSRECCCGRGETADEARIKSCLGGARGYKYKSDCLYCKNSKAKKELLRPPLGGRRVSEHIVKSRVFGELLRAPFLSFCGLNNPICTRTLICRTIGQTSQFGLVPKHVRVLDHTVRLEIGSAERAQARTIVAHKRTLQHAQPRRRHRRAAGTAAAGSRPARPRSADGDPRWRGIAVLAEQERRQQPHRCLNLCCTVQPDRGTRLAMGIRLPKRREYPVTQKTRGRDAGPT